MAGNPDRPWSQDSSDEFGREATRSTFYEIEATQIRFWGTCPACTHEFEYFWPLQLVIALDQEPSDPVVMCRCKANTHAGRLPGELSGCGAYWKSRVVT